MSYYKQYEYIARMIRPVLPPSDDEYDYVTRLDRVYFKKWEKGIISLQSCLEEFRKNNAVPILAEIDINDFKGWLVNELKYKEGRSD